jgi:MFS family permease
MPVYASLQKWLSQKPGWFIAVYAAFCSFCVYFSMYAFRKPFTAAGFEGKYFLHVDYKVWLVTAQVTGYMLSKFYGIKFISSIHKETRAGAIVKLILISWIALLLFAVTPAPYNIIFLLVNGFPLGMVWGLVFSFLEGRRQTEFMGAVLAVSFIFSSGVVKSLGKTLMLSYHVSEMWMPFFAGGLFVLPMLLFTLLLNHLPPPTNADIALRSIRKPMTQQERKSFLALFLPGIIIIVSTYVLLTVLRDFRDNFANELWSELGFKNQASIFTKTEIPVSLIVLLCMSLLIVVKDNIKAFMINHYIIISGYTLALVSTLLFTFNHIDGVLWMILIGTGLYLSYVPFNALYFERMIASYKVKGNVGFIMYIADAFGYLGSVIVLFVKQFFGLHVSWITFFVDAVLGISVLGIAGTVMAAIYFKNKYYSTPIYAS